MANSNTTRVFLVHLLLLLLYLAPSILSSTAKIDAGDLNVASTYIVHVSSSHKPRSFRTHAHWHRSTLRSLGGHPAARLLYSYSLAASGFSATLTPSQASALRRHPSVLSLSPDLPRQLHTTHTPSFLRLSNSSGLWPSSSFAEDVVVAVLDTGIWPHRASFSDSGLSPSPPSWKGSCFPGFPCNRKLVGAKFFCKGYEAHRGRPINETEESRSPLDTEGHGTHTASTAAGAVVPDASLFGYAAGEARGMATRARIAAYKICWTNGCFDSDILAAMDEAVADGANIISLSVGSSGYSSPFYRDSIAIGAFGAMKHGVLVSCSAGNSGPGPFTAVNIAPWILTVGASTVDRDFPADAILGDDTIYDGVSLYSSGENDKTSLPVLPLVYSGDCGSRLCIAGELDPSLVAGKIVLCDRGLTARVAKGAAVKLAGGAGMILANTAENGEELVADAHLLPATMVGAVAGDKIRDYIRSNPNPTATIVFRGTVIGPDPPSPQVAAFSSRGPNYCSPEILKPDVIAPGVNILAAWTGGESPTSLAVDSRRVEFNIISGTSMSCPHASGIAALLRRAHPDWSPGAIKSALMTTTFNVDGSGEVIKDLATGLDANPYVFGSGHVAPNRALDPGLVYDVASDDYVAYLCASGYTASQIAVFVARANCSSYDVPASPGDLNYPSFSVVFRGDGEEVTLGRTVKNVGGGAAVYKVKVMVPDGIEAEVSPEKLEFEEEGDMVEYKVKFSCNGKDVEEGSYKFGWIEWSDGVHVVRSPISFTWKSGVALASY